MALDIFNQIIDRSITTISENDLLDVSFIGSYCFSSCTSLVNVIIPKNVKSIEENSFANCAALENITINNDSVSYIGDRAFYSCSTLKSITIPEGVTSIGVSAFGSCFGLTNVSIPSSVTSIGNLTFAYTSGSMSITDAYFLQPLGMEITLPTAGSSTGMFYVKTARSMNVHTDNETIKNYAWATDNITPTFYHLDGTPW